MQTKSLAVLDFVAKFLVFLVHDEEGVQIALIGVGIALADITGALLLGGPDTDRVLTLGLLSELVLQGSLAGFEIAELLLHFAVHLYVVCLQDPGIAKGVAVVKHFLEMLSAEAGLIGLLADVAFHVGGAGAEDEVQKILFYIALYEAEGTFITGVHGIV